MGEKKRPVREKWPTGVQIRKGRRIHLPKTPKHPFCDLSTDQSAFWTLHNYKPVGKGQTAPPHSRLVCELAPFGDPWGHEESISVESRITELSTLHQLY